MMKSISVADLEHEGGMRTIGEAQQAPVLLTRDNRPVAWVVSADGLAQVTRSRDEVAATYRDALQLLAVEFYRNAVLTLGQGATLAKLPLGDFIDLCARLEIPILWETERDLDAEVEAAAAMADDAPSGP
jgi:predicted HTH domain antitoxin